MCSKIALVNVAMVILYCTVTLFRDYIHYNEVESKQKHDVMEPCAVVDYYLTLSRLQHIYHWQPYVRVDFILQSGT